MAHIASELFRLSKPVDCSGAENKLYGGWFCLGFAALEFIAPPKAPEWVWLRNTINQIFGSYGYVGLLVLICTALWIWSYREYKKNEEEELFRRAALSILRIELLEKYGLTFHPYR